VALHRFIKEKRFTPTHKFIQALKSGRVVTEGDESDLLQPTQSCAFQNEITAELQ
jgi:hypothetical protein